VNVEPFIERFFGYGTWSAPVWFIGMEEGGGSSLAEVETRIETWRARGANELENLAEFHRAIGVTRHFGGRPALQRTWAKLIHVLFGLRGEVADTERVRIYQATRLGRHGGETALIELLPLPSPSTRDWLYREISDIPYLATRESYRQHVAPLRVWRLRERIAQHRPQVVIFYGVAYRDWWSRIEGEPGTKFVTIPHPASYGMTNQDFYDLGAAIR
jgi:hypothetical protein